MESIVKSQNAATAGPQRSNSISQASESSQTAHEYIASQLRLEAEAREALPYQFDTCTKPLGPLRQSVFACLTCTPPPASAHQQFTPAGVCYSCSISCHGEHNLVELFTKRNFACDCGTTRFNNSNTPCMLRPNPRTGLKGDVTGDEAREGNKYDQNYQGKFCGCEDEYDPEKEKGTMFQCLGLGTVEDGGCGEDWWHPECLMGLPRTSIQPKPKTESNGALETVKEETTDESEEKTNDAAITSNGEPVDDAPLPPGFPDEDDFDHFICYKCVDAFPWIKQYAGTTGFLPAVSADGVANSDAARTAETATPINETPQPETKKRKAEDDEDQDSQTSKKQRPDEESSNIPAPRTNLTPKHATLPSAPTSRISLFLQEDFRDHLCRCATCFPLLAKHPQLLDEEENYEPPVSESEAGDTRNGSRSVHSGGSLLDRGEAALSSMDRVRAIEGVMAYNHVRDKVKSFLQPFAESGRPVGAEDIKAYFAKLRGDEQAMSEPGAGAAGTEAGERRE
ncbi:zf-UBR-domain-containing protein [Acrodontium crateriforme]|uniref:Zf-UBR-domain-containing protein n=1 Tax=Acrodontium crateriforme TaxID=150365 RepID=A0AAQ3M5N9_9PEZI|nr:zf-UBR-domain-containing protein [Acrodontium crateriforme]